jgi:3-deoxy-D-manno-octulosonic-acid transferase
MESIKIRVYDLLLIFYVIIMSPLFLIRILKGKYRKSFKRRFFSGPGLAESKKIDSQKKLVWIHAVSVGEVNSVRHLVKSLKKNDSVSVMITSVTETGNFYALKNCPEADVITYLPFDFSWLIKSFYKNFRPACLVVAETEIWPNLLWQAHAFKVPVIYVNGRISDKTKGVYKKFSCFFKDVLKDVHLFLMQDSQARDRIIAAGARASKVVIAGNMKYDSLPQPNEKPDKQIQRFIQDSSVILGDPKVPFILAASTHPKEEELIARAVFKALDKVNLAIVPRHIERTPHIVRRLQKKLNLQCSLRSKDSWKAQSLLIVDTIGELTEFYKLCSFVIMGGTFEKIGGHNILEPAACAKAVIFGPEMFNFESEKKLLKNAGAFEVKDENSLIEQIRFLAQNKKACEQAGSLGLEKVNSLRGASKKAEYIIMGLINQRN